MSFIQREIDLLHEAIVGATNEIERGRLYAARQALAWALEPTGFKAPLNMIKGIQGAQEDCSDESHPLQSSNIHRLAPFSQ
jgi:hypothetical protein